MGQERALCLILCSSKHHSEGERANLHFGVSGPDWEAALSEAVSQASYRPTSLEEAVAASTFEERLIARGWALSVIRSGDEARKYMGREAMRMIRLRAEQARDAQYLEHDDAATAANAEKWKKKPTESDPSGAEASHLFGSLIFTGSVVP